MSQRPSRKAYRHRGALLLSAVTAFTVLIPAGALLPVAANAATGPLWVSKAATVAGTGSSCAKPGFNTIQSAINAATAGQTVKVCASTYAEQLTVTKSLTISGAGAAAVHVTTPAAPAESSCLPGPGLDGNHKWSLLDVCGSGVKLTASGITLSGSWTLPDACADQVFGATATAGATLVLNNSTVTGARLADRVGLGGCQTGVGILAGRAAYSTSGKLVTHNVTVADYQKGGIVVSNAGSTAALNATTVDGDPTNLGPDPGIARNGVQFSSGASGTIFGGLIRGNECGVTGACNNDIVNGTQSGGLITVASGKVTVTAAVITGNDIGVLTDSTTPGNTVAVFGSQLADNRYAGAYADSGPLTLTGDTITGSSVAGVATVSYDSYGSPLALTVSNSSLAGNGKALWVTSDGAAGDLAPAKLFAEHNRITSNIDGVVNDTAAVIDATRSYWGALDGPSSWNFGSGNSVSANVNFFPWAKTASMNAMVVCGDTTLPGEHIICGTTGNNVLTSGNTGSTLMLGQGGSDQFRGGAGDDYIIGNPGNDYIDAGAGINHVQGRGGSDVCVNATFVSGC